MKNRFTANIPIIMILVLFVINIFILTMTHRSWNEQTKVHFHLKEHVNTLIYELNIGYIWIEELLRDEGHTDFDKEVSKRFTAMLNNNEAFLKQSASSQAIAQYHYTLSTLPKLQSKISELHDAAKLFWEKSDAYPPEGTLDKLFHEITAQFVLMNRELTEKTEEEIDKLNSTFVINLVILLAANLTMILLLYRFNRSKNRYEQALVDQKRIFETLFQKSFDGVLILEGGHIVDTNESMLAMLELSGKEEMLDAKVSQFSPERQPDGKVSAQEFPRMIELALEKGPQRFEWQLEKSDGELFFAEMALTPIQIGEKTIIHIVSHDISERKALAESLKQKNALYKEFNEQLDHQVKEQTSYMVQQSRLAQMGEMISMIAHQWRQPLASISAISGTLSMDVMMDAYKKEFFEERLQAISDLSQHLSSTIDDFRGFFKATKEETEVNWEEMVTNSLKIIGPTLKTKNITVHTAFENDEKFYTHTNEVKQVILNIVKNAEDILLEKEVENAQIWIKSHADNGISYLTIEDNAGGIHDDIIDKVFDPYFSTKEKKDGTGLGLYMSKTIVTEHCFGALRVRNTERGALFEVALPIERRQKKRS